MHSLKNTVVAVLLLGASYGIYNVLTTPDPTVNQAANEELLAPVGYQNGMQIESPTIPPKFNGMNQGNGQSMAQSVAPIQAPPIPRAPRMTSQPPNQNPAMVQQYEPTITTSRDDRDAELIDQLKNQINSTTGNVKQAMSDNFVQAKTNVMDAARKIEDRATVAAQDFKSNFNQKIAQPIKQFASQDFAPKSDIPPAQEAVQPVADSIKKAANDFANDFAGMVQGAEDSIAKSASDLKPKGVYPLGGGQPLIAQRQPANSAPNSSAQRVPTDAKDEGLKLTSSLEAASPMAKQPVAAGSSGGLNATWPKVDSMINDGNFRGALGTLSKFYDSSMLAVAERQRLHEWLDALAGKVIYSSENTLFQKPYVVQEGESLADIAHRWGVPAQLIYNINRSKISETADVQPGTEIKMITGPFNAQLDVKSGTMTLFLKNLYAGRFPVRLGTMGELRGGEYKVVAKNMQGHSYRDGQGNEFPIGTVGNGYGPYWVGMEGGLCIHATGNAVSHGHPGCIGLNSKDAADMFGILSEGSVITVVR